MCHCKESKKTACTIRMHVHGNIKMSLWLLQQLHRLAGRSVSICSQRWPRKIACLEESWRQSIAHKSKRGIRQSAAREALVKLTLPGKLAVVFQQWQLCKQQPAQRVRQCFFHQVPCCNQSQVPQRRCTRALRPRSRKQFPAVYW